MKTVFSKSSLFVSLLILLCFSIVSLKAQSLKGKIWQSQDTLNVNERPSTFIFNENTYTMHEFNYSSPEVINYTNKPQTGTFEEKQGELILVRCINGSAVRSYSYKLEWISDTEFSITMGIQKTKYSLFNSPEDHFTPKLILPYLKNAIKNGEVTPACFANISTKYKAEANESESIAAEKKLKKEKYQAEQKDKMEKYKREILDQTKKDSNQYIGSVKGRIFECADIRGTDVMIFIFEENGSYSFFRRVVSPGIYVENREYGNYVEIEGAIEFTIIKSFREYENGKSVNNSAKMAQSRTQAEVKWLNENNVKMNVGGRSNLFIVTEKSTLHEKYRNSSIDFFLKL